ncbi:cysteine hydrolase [Nonomuraea sp. NPDC050404]|uniref:cysteine hydrolase family protein n=1 Tax=Nonomuraea sp. NPDC050404 TaxID=3155783 RepID=UPI003410F4AA
MTTTEATDRTRTAFLALDFVTYIVENYSHDPAVVQHAARALESARTAGLPVFHVVPGPMREQIHPALAPRDDEPVLAKSSFAAFATTDLHERLRAAGVGRLVIAGVATSGTVLSTTRWAHDLGYQVAVCANACADPDPQAHAALVDTTIFPDSWLGLWRIARMVHPAEVGDAIWEA